MKMISLAGIQVGYGRQEVLNQLDLEISEGEFVGIVGPNGAGKSTLIKVMAGALNVDAGVVSYPFLGENFSLKEKSRNLAVLFQDQVPPLDITVEDIVTLGRLPYFKPLQWKASPRDREYVDRAMEWTGTRSLAQRYFSGLSGGERQRVLLGMALARNPRVLLLDEPVQNLDIRHQLEVFEVLRTLNSTKQVMVATVLHDINLAGRYCSRLILLKEGVVLADGSPDRLLNPELLEQLYGIKIMVQQISGGKRFVIPAEA